MTKDNFIQPPVTTNTLREKTDVANERRIYSGSLTETLKGFNRLMLQSTINDSADDHSNKKISECDPESNPSVATQTSEGNITKSLILTLPKEIIHTNYLRSNKSQQSSHSSSRRLTQRPQMGLRQVEGLCMWYVRFSIRRLSRVQRAALQVFSKILWWQTGRAQEVWFHGIETSSECPPNPLPQSDWYWTLCIPIRIGRKKIESPRRPIITQ